MRAIFLSLIFLLATDVVAADPTPKTSHIANGNYNGIGAGGSVFDTWGFIYRRHFANDFAFTSSIGGWYNSWNRYIGLSLGGLYTVKHHEFDWSWLPNSSIRIYLGAYLSNVIRNDSEYKYEVLPGSSTESRVLRWDIGFGAGPGIEFFFNRYFAFHMDLPFMAVLRQSKNQIYLREARLNFGGGFVYYF